MLIHGNVNDNLRAGTAGDDTFAMFQGGDDTVQGLGGNDTFKFRAAFTAADRIDGGDDDADRLMLNGDYSAGVVFAAATLVDVEEIELRGGFDYALTSHDATVAAGLRLRVDGADLGAGDVLTFDGSAETDGGFELVGGGAGDGLTCGDSEDTFDLSGGGNDTAVSGGGNDSFFVGNTLGANDQVDGGAGDDRLILSGIEGGDSITLGANTLTGIDRIVFRPGFNGSFNTHDATVAAGETLFVSGFQLTGAFIFNGGAETDGRLVIAGGSGTDVLFGGAQADVFNLTRGGNDKVTGGDGDDVVYMGGQLTASDTVSGGLGNDTVWVDGPDVVTFTAFTATTLTGVEDLLFADGEYTFVTHDATVAAGGVLTVDGSAITAGNDLEWNGTAETDGAFDITGGAGSGDALQGGAGGDTLDGGGGSDLLVGHGGADQLTGGAGGDTFQYLAVADSAFPGFDTITGLNADEDTFDLTGVSGGSVTEVDLVSVTLGGASSFSDYVNAGCAQAGNPVAGAVAITMNGGPAAGHVILFVDASGDGSFDGADYLFDITGYTGTLDIGDFI